jgi:transposase
MEPTSCPGCQQRDVLIAALQERVAALEAQVQELRTRLGQNASNSSLPPSANPPNAPKPVVKKPSGRRRGAQPGHPAQLRRRLPPERLQQVIPFVPTTCQRCQTPLPPERDPDDPEPLWHQVAELPRVAAHVIEYQAHGRRCPCCGEITWAKIPDAVRARTIGPRLAATMSLLRGAHHVSCRGVEELVETVFDVPVALGTVSHLEGEMSQALQAAHAEALHAVRDADVKNVDETGWKQAGQKRWLWSGATATVAAFVITLGRGAAGLVALLGQAIRGIVGSDRWGVYGRIPVRQRQVCWAHLKRDFQKCVDRGGAAVRVGRRGVEVVRQVFHHWYAFRGGGGDRARLRRRLRPVRRVLRQVLARGRRCADGPTARFCRNVLALEGALWTFARVEGVEPTNNHIERLHRKAVLWRKNAFGSQSAEGCRFVERLLTVVQTLRLQGRPVLEYLQQTLEAHRAGLPLPKLLLGA